MRSLRFLFIFSLLSMIVVSPSFALKGVLATTADVERLKNDIKEGKVKVGITRLHELINEYGEPTQKIDSDRKITLTYEGLNIEFDKKRYWREWGYDSFKSPAYTDKIKLLRQKLESKKIEGDNIPIEKFLKDYDEPTEIHLTADDGQISVYYYGDMRLTFENVYALKSWEAKNLAGAAGAQSSSPTLSTNDALSSVPAVAPTPAAAAAAAQK